MIDRKLIQANAPSNNGEQVHVNHTGCEAGEDKKRRLYIKRIEKGLLAYCHHCNESGFVKDNAGRLSTWTHKATASAGMRSSKPILAALTTEGKVWLHNNYCNPEDKLFSGVIGEQSKVALTLCNPQGEHVGWQVRNLLPNATPKYTTHYINNDHKGDPSWFHIASKTLVITEDYLSAYRVHKNTGFSSVSLLRTSLSDRTLMQINDLNFEAVVIWLDPDEAGIEGAKKVYKKLNHFLPTTTMVAIYGCDKEPKECTPAELASILI
jgi:hypothetical protein